MQSIHSFIPFMLADIYIIGLKYKFENISKDINIKNFREFEKSIDKTKFPCELLFWLNDKEKKNHISQKNILKENLDNIKKVVPNVYQEIIDIMDGLSFEYFISLECLIHNEDKYFGKCKNVKKEKNHFATMFIFPPINTMYSHIGGILKIWDRDGKEWEFYSSKAEDWTFILFQTDLEYEITPIIEGKQVIFKKDLYYIREPYKLLTYENKISNPELSINTDEENQYKSGILNFYQEKINIYYEKYNNLINNLMKSEKEMGDEISFMIQKIRKKLKIINRIIGAKYKNTLAAHNLKNITENNYPIVIYVFKKYYPVDQMSQKMYLLGNDLNFFNEIKNVYPFAYLRNFKIKLNENLKYAEFAGDLWKMKLCNLYSKKIKIIYQGDSEEDICEFNFGSFIESIETNENDCNDFYILMNYTTIIIPKNN